MTATFERTGTSQEATDDELRRLLGLPLVRTVVYEHGEFTEACKACGHVPPTSIPPELPPGEPVVDVVQDPRALRTAARTVAWLVDVLDQRRPPKQVVNLAVPEVLRYLRAVPTGPSGLRGGARLLSARASQPHEGAVEVAAMIRLGGRLRAMAASFVLAGLDAWTCTTVRIL
ncbi:hypothetical protein GCM10009836_44740 [Pseudonocardia ailaonensis]|uniref:Uncharacterized protein n=1 Tax=Pseudonocardia ailaonensis TaxID=367279 RepID=A0ABN2N9V3_9PSEU